MNEQSFRESVALVLAANEHGFPTEVAQFNVDKAWQVYRQDPGIWGDDPALAMFMEAGDWWDEEGDSST